MLENESRMSHARLKSDITLSICRLSLTVSHASVSTLSGMRLTRFSDNAIRCLIVLAIDPEQAIPVRDIAARMNMSYEHLVKIVHKLGALGYIETTRGRHGGVRLSMPPEEVNLGKLVRQTEESLALVECFDEATNTCPIADVCRLPGALDDALNAFFAVLDKRTLAYAVAPRLELTRLIGTSEA